MFVEPDLTQIYGKVTIKQDQQDYCTECYDEATKHRLLMIKRSRFCCQTVNSKIHYKSSQLFKTSITKYYHLSIVFGNYSETSTRKLQIAL